MHKRRGLIHLLCVALLILLQFIGIFLHQNKKADAQVVEENGSGHMIIEGRYINRTKIIITKIEFTDDEFLADEYKSKRNEINQKLRENALGEYEDDVIDDRINKFKKDTGCGSGNQQTSFNVPNATVENFNPVDGKVSLSNPDLWVSLPTGCTTPMAKASAVNDRIIEVTMQNAEKRYLWFYGKGNDVIVRVDGKWGDFKVDSANPLIYTPTGERGCGVWVELKEPKKDGQDQITNAFTETCLGSFGDPANVMFNPDPDNPENKTGTGATGEANQSATCETSGNPLSWILCPVFNGVADLTDWVFQALIEPFLYTSPISTDPSSGSYKAWSSFRVVGNMIIILAMLVIVFGQVIGGGIIDAYTAKKVLPRVLIAAILINLSIYIVNLAIDVTNVLGNGIGQLLFAPFRDNDFASFTLDAGQSVGAVGLGVLGVILSSGAIAGLLFSGALGSAAVYIGLAVILPAALAVLTVFATLIIRKGLILFLVLISPVAFALYCLPNTEKYFKQWWDLLFKALLMYPIITVVFVISDILSITILAANDITPAQLSSTTAVSNISNTTAAIVAFILQILPLFLIPFAFKLAGGALTGIYGAITKSSSRVGEMTKSRKEIAKRKYEAGALQGRTTKYNALNSWASTRDRSTWLGRRAAGVAGFAANRVGGYNIEAAMSAQRLETEKEMQAQIDTGVDDEIRALNTNKDLLRRVKRGATASQLQAAGYQAGRDFRTGANGQVTQLANLGGTMYDVATVERADERWGGNQAAYQKSLSYEMTKVLTQQQQDNILNNYATSSRSWGMDQDQANGAWIGAGFQQQNQNRQWKHYSIGNNGQMNANGLAMMREIDEKQGSYQMLQQNADTWTTMSQEVMRAKRVLDGTATDEDRRGMSGTDAQEILQRGARIAKQFEGSTGGLGRDPDGNPLPPGSSGYDPTSGAAGRVGEEARNYRDLFAAGGALAPYITESGVERRNTERRSGDQQQPPAQGPPTPGARPDNYR